MEEKSSGKPFPEAPFFTFTRVFLFSLTIGAVCTAVIAGCMALKNVLTYVDTTPKVAPPNSESQLLKVNYDNYREELEALKKRKEQQRSQVSAAQDQTQSQDLFKREREVAQAGKASDEYIKRFQPILDDILRDLHTFTSKTNQDTVNDAAVKASLEEPRSRLGADAWWKMLDRLRSSVSLLVSDADRIAKLPEDDPTRIKWDSFLEWFIAQYENSVSSALAEYKEQMRREEARIEGEKAKQLQARAIGMAQALVAASSLGCVILLSILLVLFRMELHLRSMKDGMVRTDLSLEEKKPQG